MLIEYSPHASGSGPRKSRLVAHREALLVSRLRVQLIGSYCSRRDSTNWASREMLRHWSQRARQRQRQQSLSLHTDRYIQHSVSMQAPFFCIAYGAGRKAPTLGNLLRRASASQWPPFPRDDRSMNLDYIETGILLNPHGAAETSWKLKVATLAPTRKRPPRAVLARGGPALAGLKGKRPLLGGGALLSHGLPPQYHRR